MSRAAMIRFMGSWALYGLGCIAHYLAWIGMPYRVYNWLMLRSVDVQGGKRGPWNPVENA